MILNISKNGHKQKVNSPVPFEQSAYAKNGYINLDIVIGKELTKDTEKEIENEINKIKNQNKKDGKDISK